MGIVSRLARSNTLVNEITDNVVTDDTENPGEGLSFLLIESSGDALILESDATNLEVLILEST